MKKITYCDELAPLSEKQIEFLAKNKRRPFKNTVEPLPLMVRLNAMTPEERKKAAELLKRMLSGGLFSNTGRNVK